MPDKEVLPITIEEIKDKTGKIISEILDETNRDEFGWPIVSLDKIKQVMKANGMKDATQLEDF